MKNHFLLALLTVGTYTINAAEAAAESTESTLAQLTSATAAIRVSAFTVVDKDDITHPDFFKDRKKKPGTSTKKHVSSSALVPATPSPETVFNRRKRSLSVPAELVPSVTREEIRLRSDIETLTAQIEKLEKGQRKSVEAVSNHTVSKKNAAKIQALKLTRCDIQTKLSIERSPNNLVAAFTRVSSLSPVKYPTPVTPSPLPASPAKFVF